MTIMVGSSVSSLLLGDAASWNSTMDTSDIPSRGIQLQELPYRNMEGRTSITAAQNRRDSLLPNIQSASRCSFQELSLPEISSQVLRFRNSAGILYDLGVQRASLETSMGTPTPTDAVSRSEESDHRNNGQALEMQKNKSTTLEDFGHRLVMGEDVQAFTSTMVFDPSITKISLTQEKFYTGSENVIRVKVKEKTLAIEEFPTNTWVDRILLAEDVQAENIRLSFVMEDIYTTLGNGETSIAQPPKGISSSSILSQASTAAHNGNIISHAKRLLQLAVSKAIPKGGELRLWFSSEVAAHLGLPFLNFSHIRGKEYVCPACKSTFRAPNPLKLHIARICDTTPSLQFWDRLNSGISSISPWTLPLFLSSPPLQSSISPALPLSCITPSSSAALKNPATITATELRCASEDRSIESQLALHRRNLLNSKSSHKSAFHRVDSHEVMHRSGVIKNALSSLQTSPFVTPSLLVSSSERISNALLNPLRVMDYSNAAYSMSTPLTNSKSSSIHPLLNSDPVSSLPKPIPSIINSESAFGLLNRTNEFTFSHNSRGESNNRTTATDPCAEVEAIVSNLGRGRGGGHVCLYCGKLYSRKYGLKIHIRTHTGYKPLSCRVCHRAFGDPSNLNKHVRLHAQGSTPYRCRHCGKVLVRRRDLARHLSSRHPDKPKLDDDVQSDEEETTSSEEEQLEVEKLDA